MALELTHPGQKIWKSAEKWKSLYDKPTSGILNDIFGRGNAYCNSLIRTQVMSPERPKDFLVVGSAVNDLPCVLLEHFKSTESVFWCTRGGKVTKKHPKRIQEVPPDAGFGGEYDIVIDNGNMDRECFMIDSPTAYIQELMNHTRHQLYIITVAHDAVIREFIKYFKSHPNHRVCLLRVPSQSSSPDFVPVPVILGIAKVQPGEDASKEAMNLIIREAWSKDGKWTFRQAHVNILRLPRLIKEWRLENYFRKIVPVHHPGVLRNFEIVDEEGKTVYTLSMYDRVMTKVTHQTAKQLKPCVAVLVPLGDDHHWLYRTPSGHQRLAEKAGTQRVLCVFLPSFTCLTSLERPGEVVERIRRDVGSHLLQLNINPKKPVLLMTQQEKFEDERTEVAKIHSELQGDILVYDVVVDKHDEEFQEDPEADKEFHPVEASEYMRRTLILANNPRVAQSEIWYIPRDKSNEYYFTHVCHSYQLLMLKAVVDMIEHSNGRKVIVGSLLGIGGGHMASLFNKVFGKKVELTCVDLDPKIVEVAREHFGFTNEKVVVADAVDYVAEKASAENKMDFLVVDINGSLGQTLEALEDVTGPHKAFLQPSFVHNAAACVSATGFVLFNSVCQTAQARRALGTHLRGFYPEVLSVTYGDELNVVFVCFSNNTAYIKESFATMRASLLRSAKNLPVLKEVVENTPLYLGAGSKQRVSVQMHSS